MKTEINLTIGKYTHNYTLCKTLAPKSYDYSGVIHLENYGGHRWLLIPSANVEYQLGRYHSGLYGSSVSDDLGQHEISELLYQRLIKE
jgi:hypothetical protein